jgi:hypothetical protein
MMPSDVWMAAALQALASPARPAPMQNRQCFPTVVRAIAARHCMNIRHMNTQLAFFIINPGDLHAFSDGARRKSSA